MAYNILLLVMVLLACINAKFSRKTKEELEEEARLEELCRHRPPRDFFRLSADGDCREVVSCDREAGTGHLRLAPLKCAMGLYFDIERQTCDWRDNVVNCDKLSRPRQIKPNLHTDSPVCPGRDDLQCGSGECLPRQLFCDRKSDCADSSDENVCSVNEDPNRATRCDLSTCVLPNCYCSPDGTRIPENLEVDHTPMMIMFSFNGAVTENIMNKIYNRLFPADRENPNGCTARATFFISHKYTNYAAVQELHRKGHEIGVFSVTSKDDPKYWTEGSYETWMAEMVGSRTIIEAFANITDGSVIGVRAPFLRAGGNDQFRMMTDHFFAYDSSLTAPLGRVPIWPYSLQHRMPHSCLGNAVCPTRNFPIWEMPINELDRRSSGDKEKMVGCHHVSSCTAIYEGEQLQELLQRNFERHYSTNRAPLSLSFNPSWLLSKDGFIDVLDSWMKHVISQYKDVYFVTEGQVIQWMLNPTEARLLRDFEEWKDKCSVRGQATCSIPNSCPLRNKELPGELLRLTTCMECPKVYPWIDNPTGVKQPSSTTFIDTIVATTTDNKDDKYPKVAPDDEEFIQIG